MARVRAAPPPELPQQGAPAPASGAPAPALGQGPDATAALTRALLQRAARARDDLEEFYRFVIRHETTKKPLEPAEHQKLLFSFVTAHRFCVVRMPIGTSKTYSMSALTLWLLGRDVTQRGAAISRVRAQAKKIVSMVSDYIEQPELNARLQLVFPHLKRSDRMGDPWSQYQITVQRPPGIRDSSLVAAGVGMVIHGARLSWVLADDSLDTENTRTPDAREKTTAGFESHQLARLDLGTGRCVFTNTPWHREDTTYYLEKQRHWATITMDIYGFVTVSNADAAWLAMAEQKYIRPSNVRPGKWRLKAFDPDPDEQVMLWPDKFTRGLIEEIRTGRAGGAGVLPHVFAQTWLCEPVDEGATRCQRAWIEKCKLAGIGTKFEHRYKGVRPTYCGIDLAIGQKSQHDLTVFYTYALEEKGIRRLLNIESGRWDGQQTIDRIKDHKQRYGCVFGVESNSGQDFLRQWTIADQRDIQIRAHDTQSANKRDLDFGVESLFVEMQQAAWIFPCEYDGSVHPELAKLIDGCLHYNPNDHTSDHLMAMWIARETNRRTLGVSKAPFHRGAMMEVVHRGGGF